VVVDMDDWEGNGGWNEIGNYGRIQRMVFDWQERTWPRQAAAVTVASRELERRAQALGARQDAIFYVPNGLTRKHFDELNQPTIDDASESPTVLLYTRFVEFDVSFVVRIMSRVRQEVPDAGLLVIGASADGRAEERLRDEARRAGIAGAVNLRGWVEPHAIPALLRRAEVAIHPFDDTPVNRAKCSVKLLELMAAGRAVVTSAVGENAHMVEVGVSGLLVPSGDASGMAQSVIALLDDPGRTKQLGVAARERVRQGYLWEDLASRIIDAYEYVLTHRRPSHA